MLKKIVMLVCVLALMVPAFGCEDEGPLEEAGKKMDEAAEDAADSLKKITE